MIFVEELALGKNMPGKREEGCKEMFRLCVSES